MKKFGSKKFGEKLREVRKLRGLTQQEMSDRMNVSHNCYASWEQGRTEPGIDSLKEMCGIFSVSADVLLGMKEDGLKDQEKKPLADGIKRADEQTK